MSEEAEAKLLKIYDGSLPVEDDLFETTRVNQVAWTLVVLLAGLVLWLAISLINAENQRNALMTRQCEDPVFKGEVDLVCLQVASSRPHWWQHLWYGMAHLSPEAPPKAPVAPRKVSR
ncbi:hypothetical protein [Massilia sp. CF038]|jgi:hypothetical protein|uniref:hypothetical protein n=1 Tax=Massilia sp. CF038 TaxID=1881045 RepID=UPI0009225717|nr:hypothetical protein [Massilia sp. CF038]SHH15328.1 hypothetical protein SAMN05428948_3049 [Massilia sp. CF038]